MRPALHSRHAKDLELSSDGKSVARDSIDLARMTWHESWRECTTPGPWRPLTAGVLATAVCERALYLPAQLGYWAGPRAGHHASDHIWGHVVAVFCADSP